MFGLQRQVSARDELLDQPTRTRHRTVAAIMRSTRECDDRLQDLICDIAFSGKRQFSYYEVKAILRGLRTMPDTLEDWCNARNSG